MVIDQFKIVESLGKESLFEDNNETSKDLKIIS